jgi:hypothetical protein
MALTDRQKQEAQDLFSKGYSTSQVYRHFGAQSLGRDSEIDVEQAVIADADKKPVFKPLANKITGLLGLDGATKTFGDVIARSRMGNTLQSDAQKSAASLVAEQSGQPVQSQQEINRAGIEAPTGKQIAGATLQAGAAIASPLIAPVSIPIAVAAGAGLGYAYDVGADLVAQSSTADTFKPGAGTIFGAAGPLALGGLSRMFKAPVASQADEMLRLDAPKSIPPTQPIASQADEMLPTPKDAPSGLGQIANEIGERFQRGGQKIVETLDEKAVMAQRLETATPPVRQAIKVGIDDAVIELADKADDATKAALREIVTIADQPPTARAGARRTTDVAADAAVEQYKLIEKQRKAIGTRIGEISDSLPAAQNIDLLPAQRNLRDVLRQNGILPDRSGRLVFRNEALRPEQQSVIQELYTKATKNEVLSAKTIHQLDQWFSATQRKTRLVDKIDDVYVKVQTPDGVQDVNVYKLFRDVFGQQLDNVAPELREVNRQYRTLSNLTDDLEAGIVRDSRFATLERGDGFATSGLRQMFGEGVHSSELSKLYEIMDAQSRSLGYAGPRADELYFFANKLRSVYPETVPDTGLRNNIASSIKDVVGKVFDAGAPDAVDQQRAIKALLEMEVK